VKIQHVTVIGAGTMGHGIAQIAAQAGCNVHLYDVTSGLVDKAIVRIRRNLEKGVEKHKLTTRERDLTLSRIHSAGSMSQACQGADLVVEAVPEKMELKQALFTEVAGMVSPTCILATNTSSLSIAGIASVLPNPERVVGTHFFNPVFVMKLLELVHHDGTSPEVLAAVQAWGHSMDKECIVVRDSPGFATSRLGICLGMEAIRMLEEGVASAEDIDKAMVLGYRHPVGPLKLTDMVGLDVRLSIGEYLAQALDNPAFAPPALLRELVERGDLGQKTGQGFYAWPSP